MKISLAARRDQLVLMDSLHARRARPLDVGAGRIPDEQHTARLNLQPVQHHRIDGGLRLDRPDLARRLDLGRFG